MEGEGSSGRSDEVVQLEEAVELLVEHLVAPVLPLGRRVDPEEALSPENQEAVARQVHATVLLYNYYHRKQFRQLEFASPERFWMSTFPGVTNKNLLMYLNQAQHTGVVMGLSVTDRAIIDACDIAQKLDPTKDSPEMITWPISKVAVLLLNETKRTCLLEHGSQTKGVWSILEKDIISNDMLEQALSNESLTLPSQPYMLQQIAYSEVERKTGMKRTDLRFIEEHWVYSLSNKGITTMLYLLHYDQTVNNMLKEVPLDNLIQRMSGPIFESGSYPTTTSVVDCYHLLPYKEVLSNILNRNWALGSSLRVPQEQEAKSNRKSKMEKITTDISTPKEKKHVKEVRDSGTNNCRSSSKNRKDRNTNNKRKFEAFKTDLATYYSEHGDCQSYIKDSQASVQMDKNGTGNNSQSTNVPRDIIPIQDVDPVVNYHALKSQKEKVAEKSDGITGNMNIHMYATLRLLQKMRDDTLREHFVLGDRSAEYEMDIQTILTEKEMTHKVTSVLKKYENSWRLMQAANPCQTMNMKRKKLKEAILLRNKCQELDEICRDSNWILPRYIVVPSVTGDMYQASVHLAGPDFNLSSDGDMKVTPHEARDSAASNMLSQLQRKARED